MIMEANSSISQTLSLVDDLFEERHTKNYTLAIQLGTNGLKAAVWDDVYNKVLALEQFVFQKSPSANRTPALVDGAIKKSAILSYPYKKVSLAIVHSKSTLVPTSLFDTNEKDALIKFNHTVEAGESVAIDNLANLEAKNIYVVSNAVEQQFKELYAVLKITHFSSSLIEHLLLTNKHKDSTRVIVYVRPEGIEIIVVDSGKLLFYNTFACQTAEDVIYYLLFVLEQLKLNPEIVNVELLGEVEKDTAVYRILFKYIRNLKFGVRPDAVEYSFKLLALPAHNHFSLFSQLLFP